MAIRKFISDELEPPTEELYQTDIVEVMCGLLQLPDMSDATLSLKYEVVWALANMAHGVEEDNKALFYAQYLLIESLDRLLFLGDAEMAELILWLYANAIGDSITIRNLLLN
mmetsp:Transcript_18944/g.13745  ORF Transcript_18944/g.13745 Transcript_18944/m.13745 type:complete len:112 (+) Transcript_18944:356-691(+)